MAGKITTFDVLEKFVAVIHWFFSGNR